MSDDDKLGDLWAGLSQDAEGSDDGPKISLPRTPITRRISLREKMAAAYFGGFIPALLALCAGCLVAVADYQAILPQGASLLGGVLVLGFVLSLPLAWLSASLWAVDHASMLRYLLLAWLAGGLGQVGMVLPYCAAASMFNQAVTLESSISYLQRLYESYLSFPPLLVYALVGAALLTLSNQLRRKWPWVELGAPPTLAKRGVAALVILAPLGCLGAGALAQGRIAPQAMWAYDTVFKTWPDPKKDARWSSLLDELAAQDEKYFDHYIDEDTHVPTWSKATFRQVQARSKELLSRYPLARGWERRRVVEALLRYHTDLDQPLEFAWLVLEASQKESRSESNNGWAGWHSDAHWALFSVVLPHLSEASLSPEQLSDDLERLVDLQASMISPQEEVERSFLGSVGRYLSSSYDSRRRAPRPMMVFGVEVPFGPEQVLAEVRLRQVVYPWLAIKDKLDWSSEKALVSSAISQAAQQKTKLQHRNENLFESKVNLVTSNCHSLQLATPFDAARLIVALRLHKAETGAYPTNLAQISSRLPKGLDLALWSLENQDGKTTLALAAARKHKNGGPIWVLR
jgi:hypothetical protein